MQWSVPYGIKYKIKPSKNAINVKFKKLNPNAITPSYAKDGDAGLDLTANWMSNMNDAYTEYGTGIAVEIPDG